MQVAMLTMKQEWLGFLFLRMHVLLFYSYGALLADPLGRRSSRFLAVCFFSKFNRDDEARRLNTCLSNPHLAWERNRLPAINYNSQWLVSVTGWILRRELLFWRQHRE